MKKLSMEKDTIKLRSIQLMSYYQAIRILIKLILIYKLKLFLLMIKELLMLVGFLGSGLICVS